MSSDQHADLVFTGGAVYTVAADRPRARAVAVRDGRIVRVGADADVRPFVGPSTEIVDLRGRMLLPGFQDSHVHAPSAGLDRLRVDLSEGHSMPEYETVIRTYADAHPEAGWIQGGGWSMDGFAGGRPLAAELDRVVPDRPVFINNRDNHGAWVNSRALEIAGITEGTPDPPDGRIERDEAGRPIGTLQEGAMDLVRRHVPPVTLDEQILGLLVAQEYLHSLGITGWQDAIIGEYSTMADSYDAYRTVAEDGRLTARVVGALWWDRRRGEDQIELLLDRRARATEGRFRATSVKIMADGVCENFTASMLDPYLAADGAPTGNTGIAFVEAEELERYIPMLDREGFQVHVHVIGDRAARSALDGIEAARRANGPNDLRHHLAHLHVVHPDDLPRLRPLGVVANCQPLWAAYEPQMIELTLPFLGPERAARQYPFGSLVRHGTALAFGSDWPVSSPNPFWAIHVAVNRTEPPAYPYSDRHDYDVFYPEERLDLATAMHAFTMGTAFVNHAEDETGSIEPGKLADLVVADRDLFAYAPHGFSDTKVLLTMVGGQKVYEAPGL